MPIKKFVVIFTNGNATSVIATSIAAAKRMTKASLDQFGKAHKVRSIREVSISDAEKGLSQTK